MRALLLVICSACLGIILHAEVTIPLENHQDPTFYVPLEIPTGATELDSSVISFPMAHQSKKGLLLHRKLAGKKAFCEIRPDQAAALVGTSYKAAEGLKPILVKWTFLEPKDEKGIDLVLTFLPTVHRKKDTLYLRSSGIDIGNIGVRTEGVLIIQVASLPTKIKSKLSITGW